VVTFILMLPSCSKAIFVGMQEPYSRLTAQSHFVLLLWATTSCALSFFLASFQVHEKSILLALAPCTLLLWQDPVFVEWFSFVCVWSLWPLLQVDRLQSAYTCMVIIFACLVWIRRVGTGQRHFPTVFSGNMIMSSIPTLSYIGMLGLHLAQVLIPPPTSLPDLYEVLWSVAGCGMFGIAWLVTIAKIYAFSLRNPTASPQVKSKAD